MRRYAARIDGNQPAIVKALRRLPGVSVEPTRSGRAGFPDLAVGYQGRSYLVEIKDPAKPPSHRRLTPAEAEWHAAWCGQVLVALTWEEIATAIGFPLASAPVAGNN